MRFLVIENLETLMRFLEKTEEDILKMIKTLPGLEKFVGEFALGIEGMPALMIFYSLQTLTQYKKHLNN